MGTKHLAKLPLFLMAVLLISGCGGSKPSLVGPLWTNNETVVNDGQEGTICTSLLFGKDRTVNMYSAVTVDTMVVVAPYRHAAGTYTAEEKGGGKSFLTLRLTAIDSTTINYKGIHYTDKGLISFVFDENTTKVFMPSTRHLSNSNKK